MKVSQRIALSVLALAAVACGQALAADGTPIDQAQALFKRYVALEHAFDPAAADLYSDSALIKNKRTYPTGEVRELSIPATKYKELIRQAMPLAKMRGDRNTYSECKYDQAAERVRIACLRYSELKKYTSPITLVVGPAATGDWLIFEELSESQP
jgi:hypothetical protein